MYVAVFRWLFDTPVHHCAHQGAGAAGSPVRRGPAGRSAMRREYVVITWGEMMAALLIMGIIAFLLFV
jgi:hypothetical protein